MLHIAIGDSEVRLLKESNQFPNDDFMSFCLMLSYGNIKNIESQEYRKLSVNSGFENIDIKHELKKLEGKIKHIKDIRLWYSRLDNEDVCNMCFLVYYLSRYDNINIYLSEIGKVWGGLCSYSSDEIINLVDKKELLKDTNIYKQLWVSLEKENSDIRVYENNTICSHDFNYLDEKILELLQQYKEINYYSFIGQCMSNSLCNFCADVFFIARIEDMIKRGAVQVTRIELEKNIIGEISTVRYICVSK